MVQERELLVVEDLVRYVATLLESCNVNQPLEVGNGFSAGEKLICAVDLLRENVSDRATRTTSQSAHFCQLAEEDIVQCCKEPVEVRGVVALVESTDEPANCHRRRPASSSRCCLPRKEHKLAQATSAEE